MTGIECKALTDGQLLAKFVTKGDESSFEELIRRHSSMVYSACRRLVRVPSDAEDAAQAVFCALSMRASDVELHSRESLAGWLYESAVHVGLRAREAAVARSRHELEASTMRDMVVSAAEEWNRLEPILDGELNALPEKYRLAIILHHLEQRSVEETAGLVCCSVDALKQRLLRGREMLKDRLTRSGPALNVALLAALLDKASTSFAPPSWFAAGKSPIGLGAALKQTVELARSAAQAMRRREHGRRVRAAMIAATLLLACSATWLAGFVMRPGAATIERDSVQQPDAQNKGPRKFATDDLRSNPHDQAPPDASKWSESKPAVSEITIVSGPKKHDRPTPTETVTPAPDHANVPVVTTDAEEIVFNRNLIAPPPMTGPVPQEEVKVAPDGPKWQDQARSQPASTSDR